MNPHLLDAYNRELLYFKELMEEFAQAHPKIARRLGMHAGEIADPFVERLVQAASFTTARLQLKLDAEFPLLTSRLLETVYPNYAAPTPSMAVARLYPNEQEGNLLEGFCVPRGTEFASRVPDGEHTSCTFRSGLDVMLYPLEIVSARLTGVPPDISSIERYCAADRPIRGALRLRLRTTGEARFEEMRGLERLPVYLTGDERVASRLFELIHAGAVASVTGLPNRFADPNQSLGIVSARAIEYTGLATDEGLLPLIGTKFHGHNLLHEYAACPARFWFFTLTGLNAGLRHVTGREAEIVILLDRFDSALVERVDASRFALFCTPVINLFRRKTDPAEIPRMGGEILLRPDRQNGSDYEVFSVESLHGFVSKGAASLEFRPLYRAVVNDETNHGRYFTTRREHGMAKTSYRRYGARATYVGTDVFASLVDQNEYSYPQTMKYLSVDAWLTNCNLPSLLAPDGTTDLTIGISAPVRSAGLIRAPSPARAPFAQRDAAWRLIGQLNLGYGTLEAQDGSGLRDILAHFAAADDVRFQRQIDSLIHVDAHPVTKKLPGQSQLRFGRGIECVLTVDETGFDGMSPYLFGVILEHYVARHVSAHSFTQSVLRSTQRGELMRWPIRTGTRSAL
ncbi:type VI secretion system baseplate subunit TssF [Burkholderia sp. AU30198]|uniref:type VI secretion system baseplate subunit TssF n=1 Tax=Burkholderia sp. AU30198 TaxID=2879627 RepID=UPI001CF55E69|nr:type VI secretion system baseplate subunit TssF [Burkholderia sp. AU30198]MCA8295654.1 type VI secretion system baseplate subunit TssF [Burkholderia sp. AU30198]